MITMIIPTRNRVDSLLRLLRSVERTADVQGVQAVVGCDEDDSPTLAALASCASWVCPVVGQRPRNLARLQNTLYSSARGEWLWLLNDDVEIVTEGWDERVRRHLGPLQYGATRPRGDEVWADDRHGYAEFPVVTRQGVEALGYLMPEQFASWGADPYLWSVYRDAGQVVELDIEVKHYRLQDLTHQWMGAINNERWHDWRQDTARLKACLPSSP